jgi:hypothetical protein
MSAPGPNGTWCYCPHQPTAGIGPASVAVEHRRLQFRLNRLHPRTGAGRLHRQRLHDLPLDRLISTKPKLARKRLKPPDNQELWNWAIDAMTGQWVPRRHKDAVAGRLQSEDPGEARLGRSADRRLGRCRGVVGWGVGTWAHQRCPLGTPAIHVEMRSSRATLPSPTTSWRMRLAVKGSWSGWRS